MRADSLDTYLQVEDVYGKYRLVEGWVNTGHCQALSSFPLGARL